jgi:hypothetical protein
LYSINRNFRPFIAGDASAIARHAPFVWESAFTVMPPLWWALNEHNQHHSSVAPLQELFAFRCLPAIPQMSLPLDCEPNRVTMMTNALSSRSAMRPVRRDERGNNSFVFTSD